MPTDFSASVAATEASSWIQRRFAQDINEQVLVCNMGNLPRGLQPESREFNHLAIKTDAFQAILHARSQDRVGGIRPSVMELIDGQLIGHMIMPVPIPTPPLLMMLTSMDPVMRSETPYFLTHMPASLIWKSYSVFLFYLLSSKTVQAAGEQAKYVQTTWNDYAAEAMKGFKAACEDSISMRLVIGNVREFRVRNKVSLVADMNLPAFYNEKAIGEFYPILYQYLVSRIYALELHIIECLRIPPSEAARNGLLTPLEEPAAESISAMCMNECAEEVAAEYANRDSGFFPLERYPQVPIAFAKYVCPPGYVHECLLRHIAAEDSEAELIRKLRGLDPVEEKPQQEKK